MKGVWGRLSFACALLLTTFGVVGAGSAGNRTGVPTFDAFPGPGTVTYGENIAYRATFLNAGGSTFTHVIFRMRIPYVELGSPPFEEATPVASTCPSTPVVVATPRGPEWTCDFGKLVPGSGTAPQLVLTVIWRVPPRAAATNCDCLKTNGRWTVKEGVNDTSDPNDAFPPGGTDVSATLLASASDGSESLRAGGYETAPDSCAGTDPAGNLRTNPLVSLTNPVSTTVCLPPFLVTATDLGHATTITELAGNPRRSEVCVAALGTNCGDGYVDASFAPAYVTHVFRVADAALAKNEKITQVSHNGFPLAACPNTDPNGCVVSIVLDRKTKIWTIVAKSFSNGFWSWP